MRVLLGVLLLVLSVVCVSGDSYRENSYGALFSRWVVDNHKSYNVDEFHYRFNIWVSNYQLIESINAQNNSFTLAMNKFGDLTQSEFRKQYLGYKPRARTSISTASHRQAPHRNLTRPRASSLDWRNSNAVTPVKDQGSCGACWSFSATGSIEGAWAIAKGSLVSLSEQQLIDCSTSQGNNGCNGGLMDDAFQYVEANGIGSEDAYPYTASGPNTCQSATTVATISSYVDVTPLNEDDLLSAVNIGPVSIAIEADQAVFQYYSSGVLDSSACGTTLDHGVLIVGYGTSTEDYWIVKNSWGASWGQSGYVYLARNKNTCGLSQDPSYPVV